MPKILVIGNGFDIYHGLHTKYSQFIEFTGNPDVDESRIRSICRNNPFLNYFRVVYKEEDGWINCEQEIENVIKTISHIIENCIDKNHKVKINKFESRIVDSFKKYLSDYSQLVMVQPSYFSTQYSLFNKNRLLNDLKNDLDEVIEVLAYYLKNINKDKHFRSQQILDIGQIDYVVSFNYTQTYEIYRVPSQKVFHPHGVLNNIDSMVLGTQDSEELGLDFIYFKKFFQRMQKNRAAR